MRSFAFESLKWNGMEELAKALPQLWRNSELSALEPLEQSLGHQPFRSAPLIGKAVEVSAHVAPYFWSVRPVLRSEVVGLVKPVARR